MNIKEISMKKIENAGELKAVASVTFEGGFTVKNFRLVQNRQDESKIYVKFPVAWVGNKEEGRESPIFWIEDVDLRKEFANTLIRIYNNEKDKVGYKFTIVN